MPIKLSDPAALSIGIVFAVAAIASCVTLRAKYGLLNDVMSIASIFAFGFIQYNCDHL